MSLNKDNIELKLKGEYSNQSDKKKIRTMSKGSFSYKRSSLHGVKEVSVNNQDVEIEDDMSVVDDRQASWVNAAQWMIADIVGAGVLSISGGLVALGWSLGMIFLVIMMPLNIYASILLSRIRCLHPECVTMMDIARACIGEKAMYFTAFCVYFNLLLVLGDYLLLCGDVLGFGLYDVHYCKYTWSLIAAAILIPMSQSRSLADVSWLCWINMVTILATLGISLVYLLSQGRETTLGDSYTENIAATLDFWSFFGGLSKFMFAYSGQFMYLEIMSEMKTPEDFPKTFLILSPFQGLVYFSTGIIGYYYLGQNAAGDIVQNAIPFNGLLRTTAFILLVHMLITYLIKGTVMARAIHIIVDKQHCSTRTTKSKIQWFCITVALLGFCYVLANLIPFFDQLTGLCGALLQPFTAMIIPITCYLFAQRQHGFEIPKWEWIPITICYTLAFTLWIVGTVSNFKDIIASADDFGLPFSCICEGIWNTCKCSPDHIEMVCSES